MRNLLAADFTRLWKNKVFWICMAAVLFISAFNMVSACRRAVGEVTSQPLEYYYFNLAPMLGLIWAVFSGLFVGTEYSDGTLRNKLIVGRSRTEVYLSTFIVSLTGACLLTVCGMVLGLIGIPTFGFFAFGWKGYLLYCGLFFLSTFSTIALLTCVQLLIHNRAISAVVSILLFLGLLLLASMLYNSLMEPETVSGIVMTQDGMEWGESEGNPLYVGGLRRTIYEFLLPFLPTGQQILIADQAVAKPVLMAVSSVCLTACLLVGGIFAFRKKDLK